VALSSKKRRERKKKRERGREVGRGREHFNANGISGLSEREQREGKKGIEKKGEGRRHKIKKKEGGGEINHSLSVPLSSTFFQSLFALCR